MALKRNETYPGRFSNPTDDHPQGAFKNRSAPGAQDGSYLEQQWANDWDGFFGRLLTLAGVTPNGKVDTASSSQYYDALIAAVKSELGTAAQRNVGTGTSQIPDMSSFVSNSIPGVFSSVVIAGTRRIMEGNGSGTFVNGVLSFTLPLAFPDTGFTFIPTDAGAGVVSYAAAPSSGSVVTIYGKDANGNMLNASYGFKYIAMGGVS